ncbi:MAG: M6 family metalloprotease domain-containing protein [Fibrobacterales bacterium]
MNKRDTMENRAIVHGSSNNKSFKRMVLLGILLFNSLLYAAPYFGQNMTYTQPDGSEVILKMYGDEYYMRALTEDGYTVIRDEDTGWICYAELSDNNQQLISTGIHYTPKSGISAQSTQTRDALLHLDKNIDLPSDVIELKRQEAKELLKPVSPEISSSAASAIVSLAAEPTPSYDVRGRYKGLTILVDFSDAPATTSSAVFSEFLNSETSSVGSNNGSLKRFFSDVSGGLVQYENVVYGFIRAPRTFAEYDAMGYAQGAPEILGYALQQIDDMGFDFSTLSTTGNQITAINLMYTGNPRGWSLGMWYHASSYGGFTADGVRSGRYNTSPANGTPELATVAHENGHMLMHWPDTYKYSSDTGPDGIGAFDLMCNYGSGTNPVPPNPYFRWLAGWTTVTDITNYQGDVSDNANDNTILKYTRTGNPREFFILENSLKQGRRAYNPDQGLTIWHVDQDGNNQTTYHEVDLEHANNNIQDQGGACWKQGRNESFTNYSTPSAQWRDGSASGLEITSVSSVGQSLSLRLGTLTPANTPPTLSITAPAAGEYEGADLPLAVSADAQDSDGYVERVEYYINGEYYTTSYVAPYTFNWAPQPGTYRLTAQAFDDENAPSLPQERMVTINQEGLISQVDWSLHYVNSEETSSENGAAINAFDGDINTIWHTNYSNGSDVFPHEIQINLAEVYDLTGFSYTPRQVGVNGTIMQYELYVSMDGSHWGSAVTSGAFAADQSQKQVTFNNVTGSYIRFVALSEINGNSWASAAEINLYGTLNTQTAIVLPGRLEVEEYNEGGEGIGYHDASAGNSGGAYRDDDVDIQVTTDISGGYNVGWTSAGEWLAYDVTVAESGSYSMTMRMASNSTGNKTARVLIDDVQVAEFTLTKIEGWQAWKDITVTGVDLTTGNHTLKISLVSSSVNINYVDVIKETEENKVPIVAITSPVSGTYDQQTFSLSAEARDSDGTVVQVDYYIDGIFYQTSATAPYWVDWTPSEGTYTIIAYAWDEESAYGASKEITITIGEQSGIALPGRIEAEEYNAGGEGYGYHDLSYGNLGGKYRNDDVDIETTQDIGGGYNVGWTSTGEWLAYDVYVQQSGEFSLTMRMASGTAGNKTAYVYVDNDRVATFTLTELRGWQQWRDVTVSGVNVTAGNHLIYIQMGSSELNINYLDVIPTP